MENFKDIKLEDIQKAVLDMEKERAFHMQALGIVLRLFQIKKAGITSEKRLCEEIVTILAQETNFDNVSILLYNSEEDCLELKAASGIVDISGDAERVEREINRDLRFKRDQGIAWKVFDSQQPRFIEDCEKYKLPVIEGAKIYPKSLVCLPIQDGVICLSSSKKRIFPNYVKRNFIIISDVISHLLQLHEPNEFLTQGHYKIQNLVDSNYRDVRGGKEFNESIIDYLMVTMEEAPQGICILDKNGNIIKINKAICSKLQTDPEVIKEKGIGRFFFDASTYLSLAKAVRENKFKKLTHTRLIKPDGTTFLADIFYHPINEKYGKNRGGILFIHDLSDQLRDSEQKVREEKLKALGSMAAGIAHDFNNLLMAILGNVELLLLQLKGTPYERHLRNIELCVNDGAKTIQRIQAFVKGRQKTPISKKAISVSEVIKEAIQFTKPLWKDDCQKRGIYISITTEFANNITANISEYELREVLVNLLINAVEAMPDGGKIHIKTYKKDSKAVIEITDTGIGMDEETMSHIFDPYFSTKETGSSGLGLSIVYGLISNVGGEIEVTSQKGLGTTFYIYLPSTTEVSKPSIETTKKEEKPSKALKILVVDDELQIVELLKIMLENLGNKVLTCTEPEEALSILEKDKFDLILTDLGMPKISGWDLAAFVKEKNIPTKVVLMTGWGHTYKDEDLNKKGIDALLSKPFKLKDLLELFSKLFPKN